LGSEEGGWEGGVSLDQPQWVNVYDPLARGGIKSKEKLRKCVTDIARIGA